MSTPLATESASGGTKSAEQLMKAAQEIVRFLGVPMGPSKVSRLVRTFTARVEQNGFDLFDFLANSAQLTAQQRRTALSNPELEKVISYWDPTGDDASDNVDRERGRR